MDTGQAVLISSQLILGAIAVFLAILLWSKTRDIPWMFMVVGMVTAYIEIINSILVLYGFVLFERQLIGNVPLLEIILPSLKLIFFIAAFFTMVYRQFKR